MATGKSTRPTSRFADRILYCHPYDDPPVGRYAIQVFCDDLHPFVKSGEYIVLDSSVKNQPGHKVLIGTKSGYARIRELVAKGDGRITVRGIIDGRRQSWTIGFVRFMHTIVATEYVDSGEWQEAARHEYEGLVNEP